jgi:hypothetical protein
MHPCQAQALTVQKHGTPNGTTPAHAALLRDMSHADSDVHASLDVPTLEECTGDYDDTKVSVPFSSVTLSFSLAPGRDLSEILVVHSACSIN